MTTAKVYLVPWDPTNERQYQRMYDQRVACGWRADEVDEWKDKQLKGTKFHYWIIIADSLPDREKLIAQHVAKYTAEKDAIVDTAAKVGTMARVPSGDSFIPIGHTALEDCPETSQRFGFPEGTMWLKSLYISWELQASGLGRSAMDLTETVARQPPLNCSLLALDAMQGSYQLSEAHLISLFDVRGIARPNVTRSNEEWYLRQGWVPVPVEGGGEVDVYKWEVPETGEIKEIPVVYMKKSLAV